MRLDAPTLEQCQLVRIWRNDCLETLRTTYPLREEQQAEFYRDVVCNPQSEHWYWSIIGERGRCVSKATGKEIPRGGAVLLSDVSYLQADAAIGFIGLCGLTYISWPNRIAEISLIIDPQHRSKGIGENAVDLLLVEAFDRLGLKTVVGECYHTHDGVKFWAKIAEKYRAFTAELPNRKFWAGEFHGSLYFSIDADEWMATLSPEQKGKDAKTGASCAGAREATTRRSKISTSRWGAPRAGAREATEATL